MILFSGIYSIFSANKAQWSYTCYNFAVHHFVLKPSAWLEPTRSLLPIRPHFTGSLHDDVIKWKHFPRNWPFVRGIHRSPVNSPDKGQWRGALMFFFICVWINDWVKNREAGDFRRYRAHYGVIVMRDLKHHHQTSACFVYIMHVGCDYVLSMKSLLQIHQIDITLRVRFV